MLHITCLARNEEGQEDFAWPDDRIDAVELYHGTIRIEGNDREVQISWPEKIAANLERKNGRNRVRIFL